MLYTFSPGAPHHKTIDSTTNRKMNIDCSFEQCSSLVTAEKFLLLDELGLLLSLLPNPPTPHSRKSNKLKPYENNRFNNEKQAFDTAFPEPTIRSVISPSSLVAFCRSHWSRTRAGGWSVGGRFPEVAGHAHAGNQLLGHLVDRRLESAKVVVWKILRHSAENVDRAKM